ncbi:PREDICTED: berberine bridge enzyme-like 7 isoform X2 [Camelina sativa]|uniref:Berberine bridge enzyme-like 7 isoform X1 n=1 Tax=Camelina sativa TaxID=90675 RepID=A0ABM0WZQ5_CAMSA|nr:PREDICTED: berberine bridge enzyme-like 7 isoform X1 [Camelina sativa]XP_019094662.1 PREDICTED: berberine bridge enzyme-like 7 isoform X2 [Camelina sativa]
MKDPSITLLQSLKMRYPSIMLVLFPFFFVFIWESNSPVVSSETFTQCLTSNSDQKHPISPAVFFAGNGSYSSVLESNIRNLRFNTSNTPKPFLIIAATHESHVQAAVTCGKHHNLQMKIRSGGHDYDGLSYVTHSGKPFFVLDMFNLRSVEVDVASKTAWVQTGATLGEVYYHIWEKSKTLAYPAGVCPTVGVGGHISGGGYGNMMRKYGLTIDNTLDARMVDVNGNILDRKLMGEDLFWAINGGGGSSYGVVLAYKLNLVEVPQTVNVFNISRTQEQDATEIVYRWQQVAPELPDELFIRLFIDVVNGTVSSQKTVRATFIGMFLGDTTTLLSILNRRFPELGLVRSDCIETSWVQSVFFWTNIQVGSSEKVLLDRNQTTNYLKRKSDYVREPISRTGLESIWKKMIQLEIPTMAFNPYGGAMGRIPSTATPFPYRAGNLWKIQYAANWKENRLTDRYIELTRELYQFMTPFVSKNPRQSFYNYRDVDLGTNTHNGKIRSYVEGNRYGKKYFSGNFERLVKIKTRVDSGNFFRNEEYSCVAVKCILIRLLGR